MAKQIEDIVSQIKKLVDELATLSDRRSSSHKQGTKQKNTPIKKGAAGGISMLIEEGFFNSPKDLQSTMEKLKEMGRYYSKGLISMNLLNLVKKRVLNRHKEGKGKNWHYVLRR